MSLSMGSEPEGSLSYSRFSFWGEETKEAAKLGGPKLMSSEGWSEAQVRPAASAPGPVLCLARSRG